MKLLITGLILVVLGLASGLMEKTFYGTIDENGFLQESFFLPLMFILIFAGILFWVAYLFRVLFLKLKK